ncbi:amino acid aminotransferase [Cupriavidus plantarum]|uniref:Aromatic-amino-acid transaminase n=1 Tax=Cupriavidus plantarum TaxID=942865 RepID=A0A316EQL5_9BURK|nr:amino acid aminotransferase [Cupriavidus plantarum]NYI01743.1 aromatic-amino-acid transaminase [Cupriavidus plantarum]PWK33879.1 aromatic-amino-acid transaminase [Cupriavidus plantarum]CAG2147943.1 Tyrosine aminotransferase [Cupriavidus plantarum]SMR85447.1 aromatic-amino-acid transaminase [Cupriavidus plantarum]
MFQHIEAFPGDPILSLNEDFQQDPRTNKVNLSIGIYFDDDGRLPVMKAVAEAEAALLADMGPRPYLPMSGMAAYRQAVQALVFGEDNPARVDGRIATLQTLGGSGALRVGADFLKRYFPNTELWLSDPSWENHRVVFERAGFKVNSYPYYDPATGGLKFDEMLAAIQQIPQGGIVLLHACCHNPTGVDLNNEQWLQVIDVVKQRKLLPFVDMAYQGFGSNLDDDAFVVRELARQGVPALVANSFSKNFSLYGERCGGLSVICQSADEAGRVLGQLTGAVRANYSNPPTHGARVVARVLTSPELRASWQQELATMCDRIARMRQAIHDQLREHVTGEKLSRYIKQRGMFTYTGLTADQVDRLKNEHGVYLLRSGRMCVAGLNERNVGVVANAIGQVLKG